MDAQEFISAKNLLIRNSYEVQEDGNNLIVKDPVMCSSGGGKHWIEQKNIKITSYAAACKFINERE